MTLDRTQHPCFNENAKSQFGRIHLPVAPKCNIQCNFCDRKYDCVNDNRPGVTSSVLTPTQAIAYLHKMVKIMPNLSVVGIAGPGDPFANPEETLETLRRVRADFPSMLLCVASNGLNVAPYVEEMVKLNVTHLTMTINAVDPQISQAIYSWVRDGKKIYRGRAGAEVLLSRQMESLRRCRQKGLTTKINSILIPGVNDHHIVDVARVFAEQGADLLNCIGMCHVANTPFAEIIPAGKEEIETVRRQAEQYLPQMRHCTRCRADAVGCLGQGISMQAIEIMRQIVSGSESSTERPYAAVASMEGFLVNQHLGRATDLYIYGFENHRLKFIETRLAPPAGEGDLRWKQLADVLKDCQSIFTCQAGPSPVRALESYGVKVIQTEGLIEQVLTDFFEGKPVISIRKPSACESGCAKAKAGSGCGCSA
jgi:nitrogen fixation protein NifB